MKIKRIAWAIAVQIGAWVIIIAGETRYPFHRVTADDGLSQATINAIAQDHTGFIWLGSRDGLNRFDGYEFDIFRSDPDDPCAISSSWIRHVYIDRSGVIWVGLRDGGLNRYYRETGCFQSFVHEESQSNSLSNDDVLSILEDSQGRFWVGTREGLNLMNRDKGEFRIFKHRQSEPESLSHDQINVIFEDRENRLWIGTRDGLSLLDPAAKTFKSWKNRPEDPSTLSNNYVRALFEDSHGRFWVGTSDGLNLMDRENGVFQLINLSKAPEDSPLVVTSIAEDHEGVLLTGTLRSGLFLLDPKGDITRISRQKDNPKSLSHDDVREIFVDRTGVVWVGTDNGLNHFDKGVLRFPFLGETQNDFGLTNPWVWSILEDQDGVLWVGLDGSGIDRIDRARSEKVNFQHAPDNPNSLSHNRIRCLLQDRSGFYWAGSDGGGLDRFTCERDGNGQWSLNIRHFRHNPNNHNSLANDWVACLLEDRSGYLWAASQGGLSRFSQDREEITNFRNSPDQPDSLGQNEVLSLIQDQDDQIWIGTRGGLDLFHEDRQAFSHFIHNPEDPNSLSHNTVRSLAYDKKGIIWIGTYGGGLNKLNHKTGGFTRYQERDGLSNNVVYGILIAENGDIWLSTNRGLSTFQPDSETFRNYTTGDGLQAQEFNSGAWFQSPSGEMFFGGIKGLNYFKPKKLIDDTSLPNPIFTKIKMDNKDLASNGPETHLLSRIIMKPGNHSLSIEFSALHYADASRNQYAYKLDGFHEDWRYTPADRRFAHFTNLHPGHYALKVKASNKDGIWNPEPANLDIEVRPPWWLSLWAKCLYVALPFLVFFLYQRRQLALTRKLERMVASRTAELAEKNEELQATQKELVNTAHSAGMAEIASAILHNAGNLLNSINTSAHFIKEGLEKDSAASLARTAQLLIQHKHNLPEFLGEDPNGQKLVPYLESLSQKMIRNNGKMVEQFNAMLHKLNQLRDIVAQQDTYVSSPFHWETVRVEHLVETALKIMDARLNEAGIQVIKSYATTPEVSVLKTKLAQGLVNIISNACEAMSGNANPKKQLQIAIFTQDQRLYLEFWDSGKGIEPKHMDKIFSQGFTTGISPSQGLHALANAMTEMKGSISVTSEGLDKGARFILQFPLEA